MKDKILRLFEAIGLTLLLFGILYLLCLGIVNHPRIMGIVLFAIMFVYVVWMIYKRIERNE